MKFPALLLAAIATVYASDAVQVARDINLKGYFNLSVKAENELLIVNVALITNSTNFGMRAWLSVKFDADVIAFTIEDKMITNVRDCYCNGTNGLDFYEDTEFGGTDDLILPDKNFPTRQKTVTRKLVTNDKYDYAFHSGSMQVHFRLLIDFTEVSGDFPLTVAPGDAMFDPSTYDGAKDINTSVGSWSLYWHAFLMLGAYPVLRLPALIFERYMRPTSGIWKGGRLVALIASLVAVLAAVIMAFKQFDGGLPRKPNSHVVFGLVLLFCFMPLLRILQLVASRCKWPFQQLERPAFLVSVPTVFAWLVILCYIIQIGTGLHFYFEILMVQKKWFGVDASGTKSARDGAFAMYSLTLVALAVGVSMLEISRQVTKSV